VANAYVQIPELRGLREVSAVGRQAEDMPNLTARICGVCPEAHHLAAAKALDRVFHVDPPPTAKKLRELFYSIFYATDHTTHFYALSGPDFVLGPDAPRRPTEHPRRGQEGRHGRGRQGAQNAARRSMPSSKLIGGRAVHPNWGLPAGSARGIDESQRKEIEARGLEAVEFARFSLKILDDVVLANKTYVELITGDVYLHKTYNMGMVDADNRTNFYDGKIRVTSPSGKEVAKYDCAGVPRSYRRAVEPWSYLKFPYLKQIGWKGFVDGEDSGVLQGDAAFALQTWRRHWPRRWPTPSTSGCTNLGRQAGPSTAGYALGPAGRVALCGRAVGGTGPRPGDHRQGSIARCPPPCRPGRGLRGGPAGHAHASLYDRRARHPDPV